MDAVRVVGNADNKITHVLGACIITSKFLASTVLHILSGGHCIDGLIMFTFGVIPVVRSRLVPRGSVWFLGNSKLLMFSYGLCVYSAWAVGGVLGWIMLISIWLHVIEAIVFYDDFSCEEDHRDGELGADRRVRWCGFVSNVLPLFVLIYLVIFGYKSV